MNKIESQLQLINQPLPMPKLDVKTNIGNHPAIASILECVNDNQGFGLQCTGSTIIFDPAELVVYDYSDGQLTKTICGNEKNFINYLKLAAVSHLTFLTSKKCIEIVRAKNIAPKIEIVEK